MNKYKGNVMLLISIVLVLFCKKKLATAIYQKNKYRKYYSLTSKWLATDDDFEQVKYKMHQNGCDNICIYGSGILGQLFYNKIKYDKNVRVKAFIESSVPKDSEYEHVPIISILQIGDKKIFDNIDAIIVTPIGDFDTIQKNILKYNNKVCILSLADVIE